MSGGNDNNDNSSSMVPVEISSEIYLKLELWASVNDMTVEELANFLLALNFRIDDNKND